MVPNPDLAAEIQRQYYTETAARYEEMHAHEGSTDAFSMKFFHSILRMLDAQSVLDVGTATGRQKKLFSFRIATALGRVPAPPG